MIYFDNAATSFYKPERVKAAVINAFNNFTANPGRSGHNLSIKTDNIIFETREKVKQFFNAGNYNVIFTKNCTEALNLAIFGTLNAGDHVITTCYEHNSVLRPLEKLKENGVEVTTLFCDVAILPTEIEKEIKQNTKLIITTACSNVTGECPNLKEIGNIAKQHKIIYLVDGAQSSGHMDINLQLLNVDMYAFSGHKGLLSITGVGGLLIKNGLNLKPITFGGTGTESENLVQPTGMPEGFEAGTIPTIPIISLNAGIEFLTKNFKKIIKIEQNLTKYLYFKLKKLNFIKIYSKESSKNVICFNIKSLDSSFVANILNEQFNICVRSGLHCAPLIHKWLGTLNTGAVRVSLDFFNTFDEIDKLINALIKINSYNC